MSVLQSKLVWLRHSCEQILASKSVFQFVVGITSNRQARRAAYDRWARNKGGQLDGFVILEWDLSPDKAVEVERFLFNQFITDDRYGVIKMHYHPAVHRGAERHDVYLAWWSEWLVESEP